MAVSRSNAGAKAKTAGRHETDEIGISGNRPQKNSLSRLSRTLLFAGGGLLLFLAIHNAILLSQDMIRGDFSAKKLHVYPRYTFMRIPATASTLRYDAFNRLAADFAQIYFPAQQSSALKEAYSDKTPDPWHRPSRYAPLLHFTCSLTLCKLTYGYASLFHMLLQIVLFAASFIYAFSRLDVMKYMMSSLLLVIVCLFLTPVGLSWFERGQFSLYVAMSYLWLMLAIARGRIIYLIISALCAFIKWTSFPYIFVILSVYIISSNNMEEVKYRLFMGILYLLTIVLCCLVFFQDSLHFIHGLYSQELFFAPGGISLATLIPKAVVKLLPVALIVIGYMDAKLNKDKYINTIQYLIGSAIILLIYPTLGCDYNIPCLFGLLPFVIHWANVHHKKNYLNKWLIKYVFLLFLISASFSIRLFQSEYILIWWYIGFSILFILSPYSTRIWNRSYVIISCFSR